MVGWSWKTTQSPGKSQSAYSALIGEQGNMYVNFTSGVQVSHSAPHPQPHLVLLVFKPITGLQAYNRTHPPGMGCKVWYIQYVVWTTCSLGNTSRCNIPLLCPLPGVQVLTWSLLFYSYLTPLWIFLYSLYNFSASLQFVFGETCSTCRCIFDVFTEGDKLSILLLHHLYLSSHYFFKLSAPFSLCFWSSHSTNIILHNAIP